MTERTDPLRPPLSPTFWPRVEKTDGCWLWRGGSWDGRYGRIKVAGRDYRTHRYSWLIHFGPIPAGLLVCHHCDTPLCVRPDHLFLGTAMDNSHDAIRKDRLARGVRNPATIRTRFLIPQIREALAQGGATRKQIAKRFQLNVTTIDRIANGVTWTQ